MRTEVTGGQQQNPMNSSRPKNLQPEQLTEGEFFREPQILRLTSSLESFSLPPFQIIKDAKKLNELAQGALLVINLIRQNNIKTAFFLDKSARPLALLVSEIWERCLPEIPLPNIQFIHVRKNEHKSEKDNQETSNLAPILVERLREHFPGTTPDGSILIVDEFSYSGRTLDRAQKIVQAMFPLAEVIGTGALAHFAPWWNDPSMQEVINTPFNPSDPIASYFVTQRMGRFALFVRQDLIQLASVVAEHMEFYPPGSFEVTPLRPIRGHNNPVRV